MGGSADRRVCAGCLPGYPLAMRSWQEAHVHKHTLVCNGLVTCRNTRVRAVAMVPLSLVAVRISPCYSVGARTSLHRHDRSQSITMREH